MASELQVFDFTSDDVSGCETLFPPELDRDSWVFYHATSSVAESEIDREGLAWRPGICSRADIEAVVDVFEAMNWAGKSHGGLVVLKAFSLQGDFASEATKPIYFREYGHRSLLYAEREFAGGESARGIRHAVRDLHAYLTDASISEQHYESQRRECVSLVRDGAIPGRVIRVKLDWLKRQCERLNELYVRCLDVEQRHTHGVVYAVRFNAEDLPWLNYSSSMGLRCFRPIPLGKIIGKARILASDFAAPSGNDSDSFFANYWRSEDPKGLLAQLKLQGGYPDHTRAARPEDRKDADIEPAGEDDAFELAVQHGTPTIVNYLRSKQAQASR